MSAYMEGTYTSKITVENFDSIIQEGTCRGHTKNVVNGSSRLYQILKGLDTSVRGSQWHKGKTFVPDPKKHSNSMIYRSDKANLLIDIKDAEMAIKPVDFKAIEEEIEIEELERQYGVGPELFI